MGSNPTGCIFFWLAESGSPGHVDVGGAGEAAKSCTTGSRRSVAGEAYDEGAFGWAGGADAAEAATKTHEAGECTEAGERVKPAVLSKRVKKTEDR